MWNLTPEAESDAKSLRELMVPRNSFFSQTKKTVSLIKRLASYGEPAAIPAIASGLFSTTTAIHNASSNGIRTLLHRVPSLDLIRLNEQLGGYHWGFVSERWDRLQPQDIESYLKKTKDVPVGNLLSFHKNGFVRHSAIRYLSNVTSGQEIRFLLIRQNDWVNSIARDAQAIVRKRLISDYLDHFVSETDLMFHLKQTCKRRDLSEFVSAYIDLLLEPAHRNSLTKAVLQASRCYGRTFVRQLIDRHGDHRSQVVKTGLGSVDPIIRVECLKESKGCVQTDELNAKLEILLLDKFVPVRLEAYQLKSRLAPSSEQTWKLGMFDKSRVIRETSIYFLRKSGCDVASLYRRELLSSPNSLAALSGLVTCCDKSDLKLFLNYLDCKYASRRAEAVRGIGRVGNLQDVLGLQKMLMDCSSRVVRAAYNQLLDVTKSIDPDLLFGLLSACPTLAGVNSILRILMESGKWNSLAYLIRGSVDSNSDVSNCSKTMLDKTLSQNRVFTQPMTTQRNQIQQALNECIPGMNKEFRHKLTLNLSSFGFVF